MNFYKVIQTEFRPLMFTQYCGRWFWSNVVLSEIYEVKCHFWTLNIIFGQRSRESDY